MSATGPGMDGSLGPDPPTGRGISPRWWFRPRRSRARVRAQLNDASVSGGANAGIDFGADEMQVWLGGSGLGVLLATFRRVTMARPDHDSGRQDGGLHDGPAAVDHGRRDPRVGDRLPRRDRGQRRAQED